MRALSSFSKLSTSQIGRLKSGAHTSVSTMGAKPYKKMRTYNQAPRISAACIKGKHRECSMLNCTCSCNHPTN